MHDPGLWSDPDRVVATTTDSNAWGGASGHTYTFTRNPDGTTDIDYLVIREGKNLRGRLLALLFKTVARGEGRAQSTPATPARRGRGMALGERRRARPASAPAK